MVSIPAATCRVAVLLCALSLMPVAARATATPDPDRKPAPSPLLRVLTQDDKALEQMKGSVCGSGPMWVGTVDDPIPVVPLFRMNCTIRREAPNTSR